MLVAVYAVSRHWGGPEEGGWWYDNTHVLYLRLVRSPGKARALAQRMRRHYPKPRYNRFSVLGDADFFVRIHPSAGNVWRENLRRPRYE